MEQYSKKAMDHFSNPSNVGTIEDADGVGQVGNMKCGDVMHVFIRVGTRINTNSKSQITNHKLQITNPNDGSHSVAGLSEEYIEDIKFKTLGCAAAIASSSMLTEIARGKSLEEAKNITRDDINEALGILPKQKYHCSILSAEALQKAIADYESKK